MFPTRLQILMFLRQAFRYPGCQGFFPNQIPDNSDEALSKREHGLFYPRYFDDGNLEPR